VEIGAADRAALHAWARSAVGDDPALALVEEQSLHLTLAFLGHRPQEEIAPIAEAVRSGSDPLGPLSCGPALWLAPRRPHVLTVGVQGDVAALHALHASTRNALEPLGLVPESRPFRPHLTVARVRRGQRPRTLDLPALPARDLVPRAVTLFRSYTGGRRARYEPLERRILAGDGAI
jgi:2'-5' RNA ligase